MAFIKDKIEEKMLVLEKMKEADDSERNPITRQAEKEIQQLEDELASISGQLADKRTAKDEKKRAVTKQNTEVKAREMLDRRTDDTENFDDMGIVLATAKIHILKQFTTPCLGSTRCSQIVLATAKIHILKQFTTEELSGLRVVNIVLATAKIHILKQFTTVNVL